MRALVARLGVMRASVGAFLGLWLALAAAPARAQPTERSRDARVDPDRESPVADNGDAGVGEHLDGSAQTRRGRPAGAKPPLSKRTDRPWLDRWTPEHGMLEVGGTFGLLFPARDVELYEPNEQRVDGGYRPVGRAAAQLGGRLGYYPLKWFGFEAEGGWAPSRTRDSDQRVHLWDLRGHAVGQLALWSVTPFVVVGGGVLGVRSDPSAVGNDVDRAFHFGLGTKVYINRWLQARIDLRDVLTSRRGQNEGATNNFEILLGLSFTVGRKLDREQKAKPKPEPAAEPKAVLSDRDRDGFFDEDDACPDDAGAAPDGCPGPADGDDDGIPDDEDACPDAAGPGPKGCPDLDADRDLIDIPGDACPDEPETRNGFEDEDGCPDTLPEEVQGLEGTIEGIVFDVGQETLRPESKTALDRAVAVLKRYAGIHVEISGHTDATGGREINMQLSEGRADAVKQYMTTQGIAAERMHTRGGGPDEPIDTNATRQGRARNRRIELRVLDFVPTTEAQAPSEEPEPEKPEQPQAPEPTTPEEPQTPEQPQAPEKPQAPDDPELKSNPWKRSDAE